MSEVPAGWFGVTARRGKAMIYINASKVVGILLPDDKADCVKIYDGSETPFHTDLDGPTVFALYNDAMRRLEQSQMAQICQHGFPIVHTEGCMS